MEMTNEQAFKEIDLVIRTALVMKEIDNREYVAVLDKFMSASASQRLQCEFRNNGIKAACHLILDMWNRQYLAIPFTQYMKKVHGYEFFYQAFELEKKRITRDHFQAYVLSKCEEFDSLPASYSDRVKALDIQIRAARLSLGLDGNVERSVVETGDLGAEDYRKDVTAQKKENKYRVFFILWENEDKRRIYLKEGQQLPQFYIKLSDPKRMREVLYGHLINLMGCRKGLFDMERFRYVFFGDFDKREEFVVCGWVLDDKRQAEDLTTNGFELVGFAHVRADAGDICLAERMARLVIN